MEGAAEGGPMTPGTEVVAYVRRSTGKQRLSRAAQLRAIRAEAVRRGWRVVAVESDTRSGKSRAGRVGLDRAVARAAADGAVLVAARLDRLSRSVMDFGALVEDARRRGYGIAVLDHDIDTTTANGRLVANVLASVAQWEREMIGERTAAALAVKRDRGWRPTRRMDAAREDGVMRAVNRHGGNDAGDDPARACVLRDHRRTPLHHTSHE